MKESSHNLPFKFRYYIEPYGEEWILKQYGGNYITKKHKHKNSLKLFAIDFCKGKDSELVILNENREIEETVKI